MAIEIDSIIPTLAIILGASIYFFGLCIGDRQLGEPNRNSHYLYGVIYTMKYLVIPFGVIIFCEYIIRQYFGNTV